MNCEACGLSKPIAARGLCRTCYSRWQRGGTVDYIRPIKNRTCSVEGCQGRVHGQGLCSKHLLRLRRTGTVEPGRKYEHKLKDPDTLISTHDLYPIWKEFRRPDTPRPVVDWWRDDFHQFISEVTPRPGRSYRLYPADRAELLGPDNYEWRESLVQKLSGEDTRTYNKRQQRAHREAYPHVYKNQELRRKYGPDYGFDAFNELWEAQGGKCAICNNVETAVDKNGKVKALTTDHDHRTDKVRQLTCQACNTMIGHAGDDIRILQAAIDYLVRHSAQPTVSRFIEKEPKT